MTWITTSKSGGIPPEIPETLGHVAEGLNAYSAMLELIKTGMSLIPSSATASPSPVSNVITEILNATAGLIDNFTRPASMHILFLPPRNYTSQDLVDVIDSAMFDPEDDQRPRYGENDSVIATLVTASIDPGNPQFSYKDLLKTMDFYKRLAGGTREASDGYVIPVPKNFRAKKVNRPSDFAGYGAHYESAGPQQPFAVKLSWDPRTQLDFIGLVPRKVKITTINIYRDTEPLSPNMTAAELQEKVLISYTFNAVDNERATFVDTSVEPDSVYYYAMAYEVEVEDAALATTPLLTHTIRVDTSKPIYASSRARSPRWRAVDSPMNAFPAIQDIATVGQEFLTKHNRFASNTASPLEEQVNLLANIIARNDAFAIKLKNLQTRIADTLNYTGSLGVAAAAFNVVGGTPALIRAIDTSLDETAAPDYSDGATTAGMLVVGGATTELELDTLKYFLRIGLGVVVPDTPTKPLAENIEDAFQRNLDARP